ncbi:PilX N-terminal domain-containing pilus assembly protein [Rhodanobacter sp. DHB23]|uniref:pilus assembly PilX family protein n=1 Tax=Rhodanobacter sp. DHB23 TaxID=2775923 RepID=UPI0017855FA0|nr:PilX N-terminal domain-containing pilus assembly protein [Rhodanobacter sp. DHB23]MBD8871994.1 pilus assembly protein [Rhodanobacter sp. DHB23]
MTAPTVPRRHRIRALQAGARAQRGIALVVALILLVLITLVGLAAMHGTIMQQRMASNQYDREQAFQSAEAAVRVASAMIVTTPSVIWHNCQAGGITCLPNPFSDPSLTSTNINTVAAGTSTGQYTATSTAYGQPQFVVENMGNWVDQTTSTGFGSTANSRNYGVQGASGTAVYYRITARSGDPAVVGDRAVVTVQAIVKQG